MPVDTRHVDVATATTGELDERRGVEFGRQRRIYGNAPPRLQMEVAIGVKGDELSDAGALASGDASAPCP